MPEANKPAAPQADKAASILLKMKNAAMSTEGGPPQLTHVDVIGFMAADYYDKAVKMAMPGAEAGGRSRWQQSVDMAIDDLRAQRNIKLANGDIADPTEIERIRNRFYRMEGHAQVAQALADLNTMVPNAPPGSAPAAPQGGGGSPVMKDFVQGIKGGFGMGNPLSPQRAPGEAPNLAGGLGSGLGRIGAIPRRLVAEPAVRWLQSDLEGMGTQIEDYVPNLFDKVAYVLDIDPKGLDRMKERNAKRRGGETGDTP